MDRLGEFFDGLDRRTRATPSEVARAYGAFLCGTTQEFPRDREFWFSREERGILLSSSIFEAADTPSAQESLYSVAIAASTDELPFLTRRMSLIMDTLVITHDLTDPILPETYQDLTGFGFIPLGQTNGQMPGWAQCTVESSHAMHCPDPETIGKWLIDCEPLLRSESLTFLPPISTWTSTTDSARSTGRIESHPPTLNTIIRDYASQNRRLVEVANTDPLKSKLVFPIAEIPLAFVDGVPMSDYAKLATEELASLDRCRDGLRELFLDLDDTPGSQDFRRRLTKIGLQLKREASGVGSELRRIRRKRAFTASGAAVSVITAMLVAVAGESLQQAATIIGASGGAWGIAQAAQEFADSRGKSTEGSFYFLWLLNKASEQSV
ncbi:hypothetical protein [Streptomyces griseus]